MNDLRFTFIDLWWLQTLAIFENMHDACQKKAEHLFSVPDHMTSQTKKICLSKFDVKWMTSGWTLMTPKLGIIEQRIHVYQKKTEHILSKWVTYFYIMAMHMFQNAKF